MKLKSILATAILLSAFSAGTASADGNCSLSVNPSPFIQPGQYFSYGIDISQVLLPGPFPPNGLPHGPYTVVFHGSKDGVQDIPASGETYPATFGLGHSNLTGYGNPGNVGGVYERYATIYAANYPNNGSYYPTCTTNSIYVVLLDSNWYL
jgi:hypothetical protein